MTRSIIVAVILASGVLWGTAFAAEVEQSGPRKGQYRSYGWMERERNSSVHEGAGDSSSAGGSDSGDAGAAAGSTGGSTGGEGNGNGEGEGCSR